MWLGRRLSGKLLDSVREYSRRAAGVCSRVHIYTGERLGADKKSAALSLVYRHAERTLTDEEVTELHSHVVTKLEQSFAAELRK